MKDLISVIVPVYKVEKYLDECIKSIVSQSYSNLEIILVDDGSPDKCPEICDEWARKDDRVKVIHKNNRGVSAARKSGLNVAKGEYISFVDSDDYIEPDLYMTVLGVTQKSDADIVVFDVNKVTENGTIIANTEKIIEEELTVENALIKLVKYDINNYYWNKLYKRELLEDSDFIEGILWEDIGAMYKIFLKSKKIYCVPLKLYNYRMRKGSIVNSINEKGLQDIFYALNTRYNDLFNIYPNIAELSFSKVAKSAIRLYDRALWANVEKIYLDAAIELLENNKHKILNLEEKSRFIWFYRNRKLYNCFRKTKHKIGIWIKR